MRIREIQAGTRKKNCNVNIRFSISIPSRKSEISLGLRGGLGLSGGLGGASGLHLQWVIGFLHLKQLGTLSMIQEIIVESQPCKGSKKAKNPGEAV